MLAPNAGWYKQKCDAERRSRIQDRAYVAMVLRNYEGQTMYAWQHMG